MRVQFYAKMAGQAAPELCTLEVFSDEIEQLSKMPLEYLVDRMHGSLVCFASRKGRKKPDFNRIRPAISADGEPIVLTARNPTLKSLLDAIAEEEFSHDW